MGRKVTEDKKARARRLENFFEVIKPISYDEYRWAIEKAFSNERKGKQIVQLDSSK